MAWDIYYEPFSTTDLSSGLDKFIDITPHSNIILTRVRVMYIFWRNPTFTGLTLDLYSFDGTAPKKLIASSTNIQTEATLAEEFNGESTLLDYAALEFHFDFDEIPLKDTVKYAFVPRATGYTGVITGDQTTTQTFIGWIRDWPAPVYRIGIPFTVESINTAPYYLYILGKAY